MIELELFYKTVSNEIRAEQAEYLKRQRSQPFEQELPTVDEISAEEYAKMRFFARLLYRWEIRKQRKRLKKALRAQKYPVDEKLTRGYNAGIEMSLRALECEFKDFSKKLEKEEM